MPFNIELDFGSGLTNSQKDAFKDAADRWMQVITGDLPGVRIDGELIDDLRITASGADIDGSGEVLGQAGPEFIRSDGFLPITGVMEFDLADLSDMEADGSLVDVIIHEMGHVIGIGTLWEDLELIEGAGTDNPLFIGPQAMSVFGELKGSASPEKVPVENTGGPGTADGHWRESEFMSELMTGFVDVGSNPLSLLSIASLADMGYEVDMGAADAFELGTAAFLVPASKRHRCRMRSPQRKMI